MNVYLLFRKGRSGKSSYYLLYVNGKFRKTENLNIRYFTAPKNHQERSHNKSAAALAKTIHSQKVVDLQYSQHAMVSPVRGKITLLSFYDKLMQERQESLGTYGNWRSSRIFLSKYMNGIDIPMDKIDENFVAGYQEYLLKARGKWDKPLSRGAALSYFIKLKVTLKTAYQQKYIKQNPAAIVKCVRADEKTRAFVTVEEIKRLMQTPCKRPELKTAYMWGCMTGMRISDIKALTWEQITFDDDTGYQVSFIQKKTKAAEVLPISNEAYKLIEPFEHRDGKVFRGLVVDNHTNKMLSKWFQDAGIKRHLTFHSSRHSFASNLLALKAADIYTVSKLLGHRRLATTEVYAHVLHQSKVEAVNKLSLFNS